MKKQKSMSFQDKLDLIQSAVRIADFWEVEPADILFWGLMSKNESEGRKKLNEWNKIAKEVEVFRKASFEERIKMLGIKLVKK